MSSQSEPISQAHSHSPVMELQSSVPQLLAAASSSDPEVRRIAVASLRAVSSYIVPPFVQALNDDDAKVRHAAAVMLGQIGLGALDAVPQLTSALADVNAQVRSAAAFALAAFGPHAIEAVPHLRTALSDDDAAVRARAAFALGQIGPAARRAAEELARLVSDSDVSVRRNIASALGGIGADAAVVVPALQQATSDVDASVRRCAITAMGLLGLSPSADASNAVNDRDAEQREIVPASLLAPLSKSKAKERSAKTDAIPLHLFQPDEADETELSYSVGHTSDALDFIAQLEDADSDVRWRASQALAQLGVSALPELIASLNHRNSEVRRLLIVSLGHLGREARSAVPAILVALHDVNADVRSAAAGCLGQVGIVSRPVVQALMQLLTDPNAEVRRHAATTLGRFGQPAHEAMTALQVTSISDISAKVRAASQAALQRISESLVGAA